MTFEQQLKSRIMRRVYGIWFIRRGAPMLAGSALFMAISLKLTAERFFVAQIWKNFEFAATSNIMGLPKFIASALNSAEPALLMFISAAGVTGFVLAVKLFRSIRSILAGQAILVSHQSRQ